MAYVDRLTVGAHLERPLSDGGWSAIACRFAALAFDEHVGDAGTIRTDWIDDVPLRGRRAQSGTSRQPSVEFGPSRDPAMRRPARAQRRGYTVIYASIPVADAHHPRHSCDKYWRTVERDARRAVPGRK